MNGYPRRLPNRCGFIENYTGTVLGLKCILYMISSVYDNKQIYTERTFKYSDFGFTNSFAHQGRKFICKTIVDAVYLNEKWLSEYANIKFDDNFVYIEYTKLLTDMCEQNATNYYLFTLNDVLNFNNIGSIKLYLIYRRSLFINSYKSESSFCCNNDTMCRIFPNYTTYRILRRAINVSIADFCKVTGFSVTVKKRADVWTIIYKISEDEEFEQELSEYDDDI